ncbi:MAG: hypothetical protein RL081_1215 [Pseudomonadota bacterium]
MGTHRSRHDGGWLQTVQVVVLHAFTCCADQRIDECAAQGAVDDHCVQIQQCSCTDGGHGQRLTCLGQPGRDKGGIGWVHDGVLVHQLGVESCLFQCLFELPARGQLQQLGGLVRCTAHAHGK